MNAKLMAACIRSEKNTVGTTADKFRDLLDELDELAAEEDAEWEVERRRRIAERESKQIWRKEKDALNAAI